MSTHQAQSLADIGEFALLAGHVFPAARRHSLGAQLGDDCGFFEVGGSLIAVSADAGPRPAVSALLQAFDFESFGWHAALATASDIATSGARPLGMIDTIDAPAEMSTSDLDAVLEGYFRACSEFGFECWGGDLRQSDALQIRVCGLGKVDHGRRIGRGGARPGDRLVLIGHAGRFMTRYLRAMRTGLHALGDDDLEVLRFPRPQSVAMRELAVAGWIEAASDSSDGVLGAIDNILQRSRVGADLELGALALDPQLCDEAEIQGLDRWNLFFCWGDWSVVAVVSESNWMSFERYMTASLEPWTPLGLIVDGPARLRRIEEDGVSEIRVIRNESFRREGFNAGFDDHLDYMLRASLRADQSADPR